jgi:hypothetical protein
MVSYIRQSAEEIAKHLDPTIEVTPDWAPLLLIYAVLMRAKGSDVDASDVHDAWAAWQEISGTTSPHLVEFAGLDQATQHADAPFVRAIHAAAAATTSDGR